MGQTIGFRRLPCRTDHKRRWSPHRRAWQTTKGDGSPHRRSRATSHLLEDLGGALRGAGFGELAGRFGHARQGIAGSSDTVGAFLKAQLTESGANYLLGQFAFGDLSLEESLRSLELFTRHVMPELRRDEG